jgi:hypothetical protein
MFRIPILIDQIQMLVELPRLYQTETLNQSLKTIVFQLPTEPVQHIVTIFQTPEFVLTVTNMNIVGVHRLHHFVIKMLIFLNLFK